MTEQAQGTELQLRAEVGGYLAQAARMEVVDQETSTAAQILVSGLKAGVKRWKAYWKPHKDRASATLQGLRDSEAEILDRAEPVIKFLSDKIVAWTVAEREKARVAQEARDKAEWEQRRRDEEAAKKIENVSSFEEAAEILAKAEPTKPMPPAVAAPRMDEAQLRDHWVWEVEDFEVIPRRYLATDDRAITEKINATPNKNDETVKGLIPGIRIFNRPIVASQFKRRV